MARPSLRRASILKSSSGCTRTTRSPVPSLPADRRRACQHPVVDKYDLSSLEQLVSGAAPLSAELALEAGAPASDARSSRAGMTEMSPASHMTYPGGFKPGSVGVTVPNIMTRIVDPESGNDLGVDEDGEIWVHGPQVMPAT